MARPGRGCALLVGAQLVGAVFATVYVRGGPVALTLSIIGTVVTTLVVLVWAAVRVNGTVVGRRYYQLRGLL